MKLPTKIRAFFALHGAKGGKSTSAAKVAAARANGRKHLPADLGFVRDSAFEDRENMRATIKRATRKGGAK